VCRFPGKDDPDVLAFLRLRIFWKWLFFSLVPVAVVALVLLGVQSIGRWAKGGLRSKDRFQIPFTEIDCSAPPSLSRPEFLNEVQSISKLPDQLALLAEELPRTLDGAFSRHPWVESVERVEVLPSRKVRIQLVFRSPVLAVLQGRGKRAIDGHGIVLPASAIGEDLPVYCSPVPPPVGPPGTDWGDGTLKSAAQTIAYLRSQAQVPRFALVESAVSGLVLTTAAGSRVLWGQPGGQDQQGQRSNQRKRDRLLLYCQKNGDLDHPDGPCQHDLRYLD
jgi:hypothetical protein